MHLLAPLWSALRIPSCTAKFGPAMPSAIPFKPAPPGSSRAPARPDPGNEIGRRPDSQAWRELQQRFRLTGAECRVALLLADGLDAAELSLHLGVSRNTIKTQSQAVYRKLGIHRQVQLILVFASLTGSGAGPQAPTRSGSTARGRSRAMGSDRSPALSGLASTASLGCSADERTVAGRSPSR